MIICAVTHRENIKNKSEIGCVDFWIGYIAASCIPAIVQISFEAIQLDLEFTE